MFQTYVEETIVGRTKDGKEIRIQSGASLDEVLEALGLVVLKEFKNGNTKIGPDANWSSIRKVK